MCVCLSTCTYFCFRHVVTRKLRPRHLNSLQTTRLPRIVWPYMSSVFRDDHSCATGPEIFTDSEGGVDLSCGDGTGKTSRKCFAHCWRVLLEPSGLPLAQGVPTNRCCMWQMISHSPFPEICSTKSGRLRVKTEVGLEDFIPRSPCEKSTLCTPGRQLSRMAKGVRQIEARSSRRGGAGCSRAPQPPQQHAEGEHQKLVAHQNLTDFPYRQLQAAHPPDLLHGPEDTRFMPLWSLAAMCVIGSSLAPCFARWAGEVPHHVALTDSPSQKFWHSSFVTSPHWASRITSTETTWTTTPSKAPVMASKNSLEITRPTPA